jgi:hypothetical protein
VSDLPLKTRADLEIKFVKNTSDHCDPKEDFDIIVELAGLAE